ncbi:MULTISPECIES: hypothetical protein [unclassified Moraxella]|uniref:hypothetical protein n=1 Tax=unclassified Moraxella TaxID=2685852 RepID=UPI003AF67AF0
MLQKPLRHPNVMSEAERLALPDPCRPIDKPVIPAGKTLTLQNDNTPALDNNHRYNNNIDKNNTWDANHPTLNSKQWSTESTLRQFIQSQQQHIHPQACGFYLPLALLKHWVGEAGFAILEQAMKRTLMLDDNLIHHPTHHHLNSHPTSPPNATNSPLPIEQRLYLMGQMYHTMLCVFLLCQCKSRKTLNPQITLQDLTNAINAYVQSHQQELAFLTQQPLMIEPKHVELAILALDWHMSKQADIGKRTTNISSQNPLTGC